MVYSNINAEQYWRMLNNINAEQYWRMLNKETDNVLVMVVTVQSRFGSHSGHG
jgi:ketosteroid isomerase-like protein